MSNISAVLILHAPEERTFSLNDPLGQNGPHLEPASLGIKVQIGKEQYGWWFDEAALAKLGLTLTRTAAHYTELRPLTEGSAPESERPA